MKKKFPHHHWSLFLSLTGAPSMTSLLQVLVFCFAVFLGSMSPSNLNIGYSTKPPMLGFVQPQPSALPPQEMGPQPMTAHDASNPYTTPNCK